MASVTRQPFAPLDGARLQNLTSMKNRQNANSPASSGKRKAAAVADIDDSENLDPFAFSKRSKGTNSTFPTKDNLRPSSFILTNKLPTTVSTPLRDSSLLKSPTKPASSPRRTTLVPKSPAAKLNTALAKSSPLSAPAGRSPTRGKRSGILSSRRRTAGPYSRVDPPAFNLSSAAPFSLDAALKGTIPSYAGSASTSSSASAGPSTTSRSSNASLAKELHEPDLKASWFFDIHEDSPEQEMTNMLQHSTCVLDISSDEESEQKATRERAEGRDKENVPPVDDVSQTTTRRAAARRVAEDAMVVEKERIALGEMDVATFYAAGCDEASVFIVPGDEEDEAGAPRQDSIAGVISEADNAATPSTLTTSTFDFATELKLPASEEERQEEVVETTVAPDCKGVVEELMGARSEEPAPKAAVLEPMEGTGETFDLWESGSAKDESEASSAPPS